MPDYSVLTLGDAIITMNPTTMGPLRYVTHFEKKVGGAELNFAIACARLGLSTKFISRLGKDEFGRFIYNFVRGEGVDMDYVQFVEGYPTSLNFKEIREDGSGRTFYYRYHSPITTLTPDDIRPEMFKKIDVVHLTGVYLAINPQNKLVVQQVIRMAKKRGAKISFDPNIRLKLWTIEEAREAFFTLFPSIDLLLTGREEISMILENESETVWEEFATKYNIELVIKDGGKGSKSYVNKRWYKQKAFPVTVVDTVGAGDGFDAGYIYALLHGYSYEERLRFANGVGALATTVSGDNEGFPYLDEVLSFINRETIIER